MNFIFFFEADKYDCWHHSHVATRHTYKNFRIPNFARNLPDNIVSRSL